MSGATITKRKFSFFVCFKLNKKNRLSLIKREFALF
jgi:hypothetical protein